MHLWSEPYHVIIEVENRKCRVLRILSQLGIEHFKVNDVRSSGGGSVRHLVELLSNQVNKIPKEMLVKSRGRRASGKSTIWIESEGCDVCNTILSHGSFLVSGRNISSHKLVYSFIAPNFDAYKNIVFALRSNNFEVKVIKVGEFKLKRKVLTERQERVLWLALKTGFFDYPRKVNTARLSRRLGISQSNLSEIIRRGVRRLLEHYFESR